MGCFECYKGLTRHTIVLEIITLVFATVCFIIDVASMANGALNHFQLIGSIGLITACLFGILAVKRSELYQVGWLAAVFSAIVSLYFVILTIFYFVLMPVPTGTSLIVIIAILIVYYAVGIGTSLALAIKHFRMLREKGQMLPCVRFFSSKDSALDKEILKKLEEIQQDHKITYNSIQRLYEHVAGSGDSLVSSSADEKIGTTTEKIDEILRENILLRERCELLERKVESLDATVV